MQTEWINIRDWRPLACSSGTHLFRLDLNTVPGEQELACSVCVIRGGQEGPVLLVTAGVHGDEYEGMAGIRQFIHDLDPKSLKGTVIAIPVVNESAYEHATRQSGLDGKNLARVFPGHADGTPTERIAHALSHYILPGCSFYCDLHSAGIHYTIVELSGYQLIEPGNDQKQHGACVAFGLPVIWATRYLPGRSLSAAREAGIPAIYVEFAGGGDCPEQGVERCRQGLMNLAAFLGMVDQDYPDTFKGTFVTDFEQGSGHLQTQGQARAAGFFQSRVGLWAKVVKGDLVGQILDPLGRVLDELKAQQEGRIVFLRKTRFVPEGESCFAVMEGAH